MRMTMTGIWWRVRARLKFVAIEQELRSPALKGTLGPLLRPAHGAAAGVIETERWSPALAHGAAAGVIATTLLLFAGGARAAELSFIPYASGQYLYESNVYRFSRQVADVTGTTDTADRSRRYLLGLETAYLWQQQKLHARVEGRDIQFEEFKSLDHEEYLLDAGIEGGILGNTTGLLNYRDERRMASFEDRRNTQLIIERDQVARGALNVALTPQWHLLAGARERRLRSPLPDAPALPQPAPGAPARRASPDFAVKEVAYNAGVQYGIENKEQPDIEAPLLFGLNLESQTVSFSGVTPQPPPPPGVTAENFDGYRLLTLEATTQYAVSGLSILDGRLGATQYRPGRGSNRSTLELTGEIGYTRDFSAVTEINVHLFRRIQPYVATADTTTDVGASIGAKWQPLLDFMILADYAWASSSFRSLSGIAPDNSGRSDRAQDASLSFSYPLFRIFGIRLFGSYSDRHSSAAYNDYTDETVGIELTFRWI